MLQHNSLSSEIGATGFEPATSRPPAERATKLRHTPVLIIIAQIAKNGSPIFIF